MNNQTTTTNEATDRKKMYAVTVSRYNIGKITEYIVIKETPKTYVVVPADEPSGRWGMRTVKKADPRVYDDYFCVGYYEALLYKKEMLENRIANNKQRIAETIKENEKYAAVIEATEAEINARSEV